MNRKQKNPRASISPIAGDRAYSRLINAVQSHFVDLIITGTLNITVAAATALRNRGSICAVFDEIGIDENGTDRWIHKGMVASTLTQMGAQRPMTATRLTTAQLAVGSYNLRETVRLWFANPVAANPRETAFLEHDARQLLQVFVKLAASGGADKIVTPGAATVTLTNLKVGVVQKYDAQETDRPYFIPIVRQIVAPVTGAASSQQIFIKTSNAIRALVVSQEDTVTGEVLDVLNGLVIRGDFRDIIGPAPEKAQDLADTQQQEFGGDMASAAHLGFYFQDHGRLSSVLNPNQDNNLRIEADVQPSVTGTGSSQLRITTLELVSDPVLCKPLDFPV